MPRKVREYAQGGAHRNTPAEVVNELIDVVNAFLADAKIKARLTADLGGGSSQRRYRSHRHVRMHNSGRFAAMQHISESGQT